ncbi:tail fiber protein [Citrobacter amalonaticus]|uniref:tail fiber protein n=1 Tax=Citrobacter amalonaticus TaxID=35703 RepID=UPI0007337BF8|nr:tail fiber protein [Citrobacter amalonaticus]PNP33391.1 integrase [Citrobacter amalonaticus]
MFHVDNSTGVPVMPQPSPVTSEAELFFTEGGNGVPPTYPGPDWFNIVQSELLNVVRTAGISPDKMDSTQLLAALGMLFLKRNNPFGDIAQDGPEAIATALSNLGLGVGAPAIGIPFFWPLAAMPNTVMDEWANMVFLKPNGASFSATTYPKLAKVWTGLVIPDMRGEFPRIWDDGRGVDAGRALLSFQVDAIRDITGSFSILSNSGAAGAMSAPTGAFSPFGAGIGPMIASSAGGTTRFEGAQFKASDVVPTATENRSRNIAFNFLIRAK